MSLGSDISLIASTFLGSGLHPFASMTCPRKVISDFLYSHLAAFSCKLASSSLLWTCVRRFSCSSFVFE